MKKSDAVILYSEKGKKIVSPYIKKPEKIFVAKNTLDTNNLIKIRNRLKERGVERVKRELGFNARYNLIFLGRLLKEKEPDRLIDVLKEVFKKIDDVELHFVGDGPMEKVLRSKAEEVGFLSKVKFWGTITDDEATGKMIYASDLMVIPGYVGLSVVHSFCFDTPLITQRQGSLGPFHAPEIEYLIDGKNGFLIDYENNERMAKIIVEYLKNNKLQQKMKKYIEYTVENICSLEKMIRGFQNAIRYCITGKR